jgi:hypothetical protein
LDQTTLPPRGLDRRRFLIGSAGVVAGAGAARALAWPQVAGAAQPTIPLPEPIASVLFDPELPIHLQLPGPTDVTLLYSQTPLMGLNKERTTVGNFEGGTALAYLLGTATGSDGEEYGLELDLRVSEGMYQAADGSVNRGLFAMI